MRGIGILTAAVAMGAAMTAFTGESAARTRLNFYYSPFHPGFEAFYGHPVYMPRQRHRYYYRDEIPAYYFEDEEEYYEPRYEPQYEPQYEPPPRPRKKSAAKPVVKPQTAQKKTSTAMSCDKAGKVVSGFGFSGVKVVDCKGQIYAFNAVRDGKNFAIKLNAVSGELAEVKKL